MLRTTVVLSLPMVSFSFSVHVVLRFGATTYVPLNLQPPETDHVRFPSALVVMIFVLTTFAPFFIEYDLTTGVVVVGGCVVGVSFKVVAVTAAAFPAAPINGAELTATV
jgi:hypothetical protein